MKSDNNNEMLPLVENDGNIIGKATRGECHNGNKLLHPVVHLHIFDKCGRIYLQRRPTWKTIQPGKWDTAVGGHIAYGESILDALKRETLEEVGIKNFVPKFLLSYLFESECEKELIYVYITHFDSDIMPTEELDGGRFWNLDEIDESFNKNILTPNFEQELLKIRDTISNI